jgi:hypothetical protein
MATSSRVMATQTEDTEHQIKSNLLHHCSLHVWQHHQQHAPSSRDTPGSSCAHSGASSGTRSTDARPDRPSSTKERREPGDTAAVTRWDSLLKDIRLLPGCCLSGVAGGMLGPAPPSSTSMLDPDSRSRGESGCWSWWRGDSNPVAACTHLRISMLSMLCRLFFELPCSADTRV